MYKALKRLAKTILPEKVLVKHEYQLRSIFAFSYRGTSHACNICNKQFKKFVDYDESELLCPFCGSRSRTRHLYKYLVTNGLLKGNVLHFSPSRSLYRMLEQNPDINYISTDFENEFIAEFNFDICSMPQANNTFDLIICYHILEHIPNDFKAMQELARVLKPNGTCVIQTPFKEGDTYEDPTITNPLERLEHFGQEDHVRVYSLKGLKERLLENGFNTVDSFTVKNSDPYLGITNSTVLVAKKE